jgi:hypothetical protein
LRRDRFALTPVGVSRNDWFRRGDSLGSVLVCVPLVDNVVRSVDPFHRL